MNDFVEFVCVFIFPLNRKRRLFDFSGKSLVLVRFEVRDVECVLCGSRWCYGQPICPCSNPCQDFELFDALVVYFLR